MQKVEEINEVQILKICLNQIVLSTNSGDIQIDGKNIEELENLNYWPSCEFAYKNDQKEFSVFTFSDKSFQNIKKLVNGGYHRIDRNDFLVSFSKMNNKYLCRICNEEISWQLKVTDGSTCYANRTIRIYKDRKMGYFQAINLEVGETIWTWDISEKHSYRAVGKVRKGHLRGDVLLWEDRFIMPVAGPIGGPSPMYVLDKDTGEELWCIDRPESPDNVIYNNRIVATGRNAIREYDLMTGELVRNEPIDLSSIDRGLVSRGLINDDKIFYYSSKGYNLVIIDYNTLEVLDTYHLEKTSPESWQIADMKVDNGRIYIKEYMERGGTVHVLEY